MKSAEMWYNRAMNWIKRAYDDLSVMPPDLATCVIMAVVIIACALMSGCRADRHTVPYDPEFPQTDAWWKGRS